MKFKPGQAVTYKDEKHTIIGWSTVEEDDEKSETFTYKYILNNSNDCVQETEISAE